MTEFYFIVIILFLFDSFVWVKNDSIGLHSYFGGNFSVRNNGIYLLNFLPTTQYYKLNKQQFILDKDGLFFIKNLKMFEKKYLIDSDYKFLPFNDIQNIEMKGGSLIINDDYIIVPHTKSILNKIYNILNSITKSKPDNIASLITQYYNKSEDTNMIKTQMKNIQKALMVLEPLGLFFFMLFFIVFPLGLFDIISLTIPFLNLFIVLGCIHLCVVGFVFFFYIRKSFENFNLSYLIPILLYPISSAHLASNLFRNVFCSYDLLSVMSVFIKDNDFIGIAKNEFNKNKVSIELSTNNNYLNYLSSKNNKIKNMFLEKGISLDDLTANPKKYDESSISYCPVCECEYLIKTGTCSDCNVNLKQYNN